MGIIGSIRKHSWIAVLIVGIAIVAFIIGDLTKNRKQEAFAKINGDEVTYDYFNTRLMEFEEEYQMRGNSSASFKDYVWQQLLAERLLGDEMSALAIEVSDAEITDMYIGRFIHPRLQQQFTNPQTGEYDRSGISNYVNQLNEMPDTMEYKAQWIKVQEQLRKDRQQSKYLVMLQTGMYMPNALANKIAEISAKSSDVRVATMRYTNANEVQLSDDDYKNYFEAHKGELNRDFFRMDNKERREVAYAVFTAQPSQNDMSEIQKEITEWWDTMRVMDERTLVDFVNIHGGYDSMFVSSDVFTSPLDTVIRGSHAGKEITPMIVSSIVKSDTRRHAYGYYVMGKILKTEMRPDSVRASVIFIPNNNYNPNLQRTPEAADHLCDSAMASIKAGMPFEEAVRQFSIDTTKGGDLDWRADGSLVFGDEIVHHAVGEVFEKEIPGKAGHYIVKVTGKTTPTLKYRLALAQKMITPSNETEKEIQERANQFASQYATCQAMIEGAASQNVNMRNDLLISMSDSLSGFTDTRDAVRWAFDEKTANGSVSATIYRSDYSYIVVGLRDIYILNKLTLEQARNVTRLDNLARLEKLGKQLSDKASEAMKGKNDIEAIAAALETSVDSVSGVAFGGYFGGNGMEPKATGAIAAKKDTGIIGPIQGASGVYVISVDNNTIAENKNADNIRQRYESTGMQAINYLVNVLQNRVKITDNRLKYL